MQETQSIKLEGEEHQITRVFKSDLKAQEAFWKRYFTMAAQILSARQKKECKKVVKNEECNSLSQAQH